MAAMGVGGRKTEGRRQEGRERRKSHKGVLLKVSRPLNCSAIAPTVSHSTCLNYISHRDRNSWKKRSLGRNGLYCLVIGGTTVLHAGRLGNGRWVVVMLHLKSGSRGKWCHCSARCLPSLNLRSQSMAYHPHGTCIFPSWVEFPWKYLQRPHGGVPLAILSPVKLTAKTGHDSSMPEMGVR